MTRIPRPVSDISAPRAEVTPPVQSGLSDARLDSLVAATQLPALDEPMPERLVELALRLSRALDGED